MRAVATVSAKNCRSRLGPQLSVKGTLLLSSASLLASSTLGVWMRLSHPNQVNQHALDRARGHAPHPTPQSDAARDRCLIGGERSSPDPAR
jgi:hypothetical protein